MHTYITLHSMSFHVMPLITLHTYIHQLVHIYMYSHAHVSIYVYTYLYIYLRTYVRTIDVYLHKIRDVRAYVAIHLHVHV